MAQKKAGGNTRNNRDSNAKYLGIKKFSGDIVFSGAILVRQRGSRFKHNSYYVSYGRDFTLFSKKKGIVFSFKKKTSIIPI